MTTLADACDQRSGRIRKARKLHAMVDKLPVVNHKGADDEKRTRSLLAQEYAPYFDDPKLHVEDGEGTSEELREYVSYLLTGTGIEPIEMVVAPLKFRSYVAPMKAS